MTDKNIKQFLPLQFRTKKVKNFMDATTETLFSEKNSEDVSFFIGRTPGGIFQPLKDYYSNEIRKIREDYQLEPVLSIRDVDSRNIISTTFYEDLLNNLKSKGSHINDHKRLFKDTSYTYAPPIDMDMFVNFNNYYWYPEGILAFEINASPNDIIGNIEYEAETVESNEIIKLSTGHHIILNDGKEYIVEGVGRYIELIEFSLEDNIPKRIDRIPESIDENGDIFERFPPEYIVMERGSVDENPWSRNNAWYHRDVVNLQIGDNRFGSSRDRQARRPIINFEKNIELYNYSNKPFEYVDLFGENLDIGFGGLLVQTNNLVVQENDPAVYRFDGNNFIQYKVAEHDSKITIKSGDFKADEFRWDDVNNKWILCQQKLKSVQAPLFNLYDSNDNEKATVLNDDMRYPESNFEGNKLFSYVTDPQDGILDQHLNLPIVYKTFQESSDIVFENFLNTTYSYTFNNNRVDIPNHFYKKLNPNRLDSDTVFIFSIHKNGKNNSTIYVNDDKLPNIVVRDGLKYRFDFSDTTTTRRGWKNQYTPIRIKDSDGKDVVSPTHGDNSKSIKTVVFNYDENNTSNENNNIFTYTDGENVGYIYVIDNPVDEEDYYNEWIKQSITNNKLLQKKVFQDNDEYYFEFEFIPKNDSFRVSLNGVSLLLNEDFFYQSNRIYFFKEIRDELKKGDYLEVEYETFEFISNPKEAIQKIHKSLSNNPLNENIDTFAFTEMFTHFSSIIDNQIYFTGDSLSRNNYRDTLKNNSLGTHVIQHKNPMAPLMFINDNNSRDIVFALQDAMRAYMSYKNILVLETENQLKFEDINQQTVKDVFDKIISNINSGKTRQHPYSNTFMFSSYRKFTNLKIDDEGILNEYADIESERNELYIFTNNGIRLINEDYDVINDVLAFETTIKPKTFNLEDIVEIRYYEDMEPTFCPSTPSKFGLEKPRKPQIVEDDSFKSKKYFIVGHDGSMNRTYSNNEDIENGEYDARDLILLEFEKRVFNGIPQKFKKDGYNAFDFNDVKEGFYRKTDYTRNELLNIEFTYFHQWVYNNNVNHTENTLYDEDNEWSYNYSDFALAGHWKGIFEYYYDTTRPHTNPWEMLGFSIKPSWWYEEYGEDFSSNNNKLWNDLENGVIRKGNLKNIDSIDYVKKENNYRRVGLSNIIPVDSNGELKTPHEIGIVSDIPSYFNAIKEWKYGDMAPVEQAWKRSSLYPFVKQIVFYILNPLAYVNEAWDTDNTFNPNKSFSLNVNNYRIYNETNSIYVPGITQWIYDLIKNNNESYEEVMENNFNRINILLGHKVGGYIDGDNMRIITNSFNPRSGDTSSILPEEDVHLFVYESKNLSESIYSGVLIEQVEPNSEDLIFEKGALYGLNDIVYIPAEKTYYKNINSLFEFSEWDRNTTYVEGRSVIFDNSIYECIETHQPDNKNPKYSDKWKLREFKSKEWGILFDKPKAKNTFFKVYGYDIYSSHFNIIPKKSGGNKKRIQVSTNKTKQINLDKWKSNTEYKIGEYVKLESGAVFRALETHTSGTEFNERLWNKINDIPLINMAETVVTTEGNDDNIVEKVPYGTIFRTQQEVAEFLMAYSRYLESDGWVFDEYDATRNQYKNWTLSIKEFLRWSFENSNAGDVISLSPSSMKMKYYTDHGVPSISRDYNKNIVALMDNRSRVITPKENEIHRLEGIYTIEPERPIYYARLNVKEYEHVIVLNNRTIFNDVLFNPLFGIRKERLLVNARKTKDWNGTLKADGYIISGDKLLPNFESSINDLRTINNMDEISTQFILNKLKYHNIGYENRDYLENIELDDESQISFYSGFIRQKGTNEAFQRILRSEIIDPDEAMTINEEWAFKEGEFGSVVNNQMIEFIIDESEMSTSPEKIYLEYLRNFEDKRNTNIVINKNDRNKWITSPTFFSQNGELWKTNRLKNIRKMPTAGYVQLSDTDYQAYNLSELNQVIKTTKRDNISDGKISWIARDTNEEYGFNVYASQKDNDIVTTEIITHGTTGTSSMILRLDNVSENCVYGLYNKDYTHTFRFKKIQDDDNLYIALPFNREEFVVIDEDLEVSDINDMEFTIWKPTRINKFQNTIHNDVHDTIDSFIQNENINVKNGLKLYIDEVRNFSSLKETIINSQPLEYWTFNNINNNKFTGEIKGHLLVPDPGYELEDNISGLGTSSNAIQTSSGYNPEDNKWPKALWSNINFSSNVNDFNAAIGFWINNDDVNFEYNFSTSVSTTIAGLSFVILEDGNIQHQVRTVQLMVDPPSTGSSWEYKIVFMIDQDIERQQTVKFEKGFNQVYIDYFSDGDDIVIKPYINGTVLKQMSVSEKNILGELNHNYNSFVVLADDSENDSESPILDHVVVYDNNNPNIIEIQNQYQVGMDKIMSDNDSRWAVYQYNSGEWDLKYKEQDVIDPNYFDNITIYDTDNNAIIEQFHIFDPIKGYYPASLINEIEYIIGYDPADYNQDKNNQATTLWADEKVSTLWLDTSKFRYIEYENFDIDTRDDLWGTLFPGSEICIYEWVKRTFPPEEFEDQSKIIDKNKYVISTEYNTITDSNITNYYYWVKNNTNIENKRIRNTTPVNIANSIRNPDNNGLGYLRILSNEVLSVMDINKVMIDNRTVMQVNYHIDNFEGEKHSQWKLLSENSREIPPKFFDKMIESIIGRTKPDENNPAGIPVPDTSVSEKNRYGNKNNPMQTWFKDTKQARKIFHEIINEKLENINVWDVNLFWEEKVDNVKRDTTLYNLIDWSKEDFDSDVIIKNVIDNRNLLKTVPLNDGEYVIVNEATGRSLSGQDSGKTIYRYIEEFDSYEKVFETLSALSFNEDFYKRDFTEQEIIELHRIFEVIFNYIFVGDNKNLKFELFFSLVRYVFVEQSNNDWVYPSTYISVNQTTNSLTQKKLYRKNREDNLVKYINEAKPFHTKLRTINRKHTRDSEKVGLYVTDFDKPPFSTFEKDVINLQEFTTERFRYRPEFYYYDKIIISNPMEYWTMNSFKNDNVHTRKIEGDYSIKGENDISDLVLLENIDNLNWKFGDGISSTNNLCVNGVEEFNYGSIIENFPSSSIAIESWIKNANQYQDGTHDLLRVKFVTDENEEGTVSFRLIKSNNSIEYKVVFFNPNNITWDIPIESFNNNSENYIMISFSTNKYRIKINGDDPIEEDFNFMNITGNNVEVLIGNNNSDMVCYDEIAVYNRMLTNYECNLHYDAGDKTKPQNSFELQKIHDFDSIEVYIEDRKLTTNEFFISNNILTLFDVPPLPDNQYENIIVRSNHLSHLNILNNNVEYRGYMSVNKSDMEEWKRTVNQKKTTILFDRIGVLPTFSLEDLLEINDYIKDSETPLKALTDRSVYDQYKKEQKLSEIDRIIIQHYNEELRNIVENTYYEQVVANSKKNFNIGSEWTEDNISVFVNDLYMNEKQYSTKQLNGDFFIKMTDKLYRDDIIKVRNKNDYNLLVKNSSEIRGVGIPYNKIDQINEFPFVINSNTSPIKLDENDDLVLNYEYIDELEQSEKEAELIVSSSNFNNDEESDELVKYSSPFLNSAEKGIPEEKAEMGVKESMVFTFKSNLKMVPRGYETIKPLDVFETVSFTSDGTETEYAIDLNVPKEQVIVLVNEDEWVMDNEPNNIQYHYRLENDKIIFHKELNENDEVIITDRYSAFDLYRDKQIYLHKNIQQGGYDGDVVLPDFLNDPNNPNHLYAVNEFREFLVYDQIGKIFFFKSFEKDSVPVVNNVDWETDFIELEQITNNFKLLTENEGKLLALYAAEYDNNGKLLRSFVEFVHYREIDDNFINNITRGVFNTRNKNFDNDKYEIRAYPISVEREIPSFTLIEPYLGIKGKPSYPKYGHIMSGKD